jgi:hypothetical protein
MSSAELEWASGEFPVCGPVSGIPLAGPLFMEDKHEQMRAQAEMPRRRRRAAAPPEREQRL